MNASTIGSSIEALPGASRKFHAGIVGVSFAVFLATTLPLLMFLKRVPLAALLLDSDDTFYYLTIARNSLHTPFYSFDGMYPTNGFHPVWEFLLYQTTRWHLLNYGDPTRVLDRLFIGNLMVLGVACALFAGFCAHQLQRWWLAFPAVSPGFLWFGVALIAPAYLANWSYLNGMESSIELLCMAAALCLFSLRVQATVRLAFSIFFFGLMVLCRLDDIFLLVPVLVLLWRSPERRNFNRFISVMPLAMIAVYLAYNRYSVGVFMPTSGSIKAGFALHENFHYAKQLIVDTHWEKVEVFGFPEIAMRVFQLLVPVLLAGMYLVSRMKERWALTEMLCVGVVLKGLYNFVYVRLFHQGSWYFASSVFIANLLIVLYLDHVGDVLYPLRGRTSQVRTWLTAAGCIAFTGLSFNIYASHVVLSRTGAWSGRVLDQRHTLRTMVQNAGSDRFIEMNDGILAYATGMPTLSGQGLVLDPQATRALARGDFFELASSRGYSLMMASHLYERQIDAYLEAQKRYSQGSLYILSPAEFKKFDILPIAYDPVSDVKLYRIVRKTLESKQP